jgi:hypothetical protein
MQISALYMRLRYVAVLTGVANRRTYLTALIHPPLILAPNNKSRYRHQQGIPHGQRPVERQLLALKVEIRLQQWFPPGNA